MKWGVILCILLSIKFLESKNIATEFQDNKAMQHYELFFREAFAQHYESFKIQKDSKGGLSFIDFCKYPPDRSLPSSSLENGRFRGEHIRDLPFLCDKSSGAKKYFFPHATMQSGYTIMRNLHIAAFLPSVMPKDTIEITQQNTTISGFWYNKRLWFFYHDSVSMESRILIFTQNKSDVEVVVQYRNYLPPPPPHTDNT